MNQLVGEIEIVMKTYELKANFFLQAVVRYPKIRSLSQ